MHEAFFVQRWWRRRRKILSFDSFPCFVVFETLYHPPSSLSLSLSLESFEVHLIPLMTSMITRKEVTYTRWAARETRKGLWQGFAFNIISELTCVKNGETTKNQTERHCDHHQLMMTKEDREEDTNPILSFYPCFNTWRGKRRIDQEHLVSLSLPLFSLFLPFTTFFLFSETETSINL